jgi:hypothetical protein
MLYAKMIPNVLTDLLIVPSDTEMAISTIFFCNTSETQYDDFWIYGVPTGETAGDENVILLKVRVDPTDTFTMDTERIILSAGDKLQAKSVYGTINSVVSAAVIS